MTDTTTTVGGDLHDQVKWFARHLRRANRAPRTISTYVEDATELASHLAERNAVDLVQRDIESYLDSLWDRGLQPATVAKRYRSIQQFCKWLEEEGEVAVSPMAKMKPPHVPEKPVPVVPDDAFETLLRHVIKDRRADLFEARRDEAILRVFVDCGLRLQEITELTVEAIDLDADQLRVYGKGRRWRVVPFGDDTAQAIHKYLRERAKHSGAKLRFKNPDDPKDVRNGEHLLWLGTKGQLRYSGILQMVKRRSRAALGLEGHIHPHQLRHTAAHHHAAAGLSETEMMRLFGWKSDAMPKLYGASAADERAQDAKRRLGVSDRFKV
jgi:site-specific recombinase XerD